jgi:hypothetical protein
MYKRLFYYAELKNLLLYFSNSFDSLLYKNNRYKRQISDFDSFPSLYDYQNKIWPVFLVNGEIVILENK